MDQEVGQLLSEETGMEKENASESNENSFCDQLWRVVEEMKASDSENVVKLDANDSVRSEIRSSDSVQENECENRMLSLPERTNNDLRHLFETTTLEDWRERRPFDILACRADIIGVVGIRHYFLYLGKYRDFKNYLPDSVFANQCVDEDSEWIAHSFGNVKQVLSRKVKAMITLDPFTPDEMKELKLVRYHNQKSEVEPEEIMARVASQLSRATYHLVFSNCEHFATWARFGNGYSEQVEFVMGALNLVKDLIIPLARVAIPSFFRMVYDIFEYPFVHPLDSIKACTTQLYNVAITSRPAFNKGTTFDDSNTEK
jgi:hypothetical protein